MGTHRCCGPASQTQRVDVNSKDNYGNTPLALAAEEGYEPVITALLE